MLRSLTFVGALSTLIASQAAALDCAQPDARWWLARQSTEAVLLIGSFDYRGEPLPEVVHEDTRAVAFFTGRLYNAEREIFATEWPAQIIAECAHWSCQGPRDGQEVMALAIGAADGDLIIKLDSCGQTLFGVPSPPDLEPILACLRGGDCGAWE